MERSNKKPRVPTSRGRSTQPQPRLPPAPPLLFLELMCPGAAGAGQGEGRASLMCKALNACTREHICTHTHARTHAYVHTHRTLCRAVHQRRERWVFSPSYLFPSLLAPWSVSSAGNRHPLTLLGSPQPPQPCGCPPCLARLPEASSKCGLSTQHWEAPPSPASWPPVSFSETTLIEARVGGRQTVLQKPSSPPTGKRHCCGGISFVAAGYQSIFSLSWQAGGRAHSVAWLESQGPSQTNFAGLGGAHQHPLFCWPCELGRALGPDLCPTSHKVKSMLLLCGAEGRPWGQSPFGAEMSVNSTSGGVFCPP